MPEYVYAAHHFHPENEDELGFRVGERIEVIEKDEEFQDGWWQGRNAAGKEGLFPVSYTTLTLDSLEQPHPALQTLREEPETESPLILSPIPKASSVPSFLDTSDDRADQGRRPPSHRKTSSDGEMMRATMTDVQKAIEQLGKGETTDDYEDGARSFSFASTKEAETETDTDYNLSDLDGGHGEGDREDWHKIARRKLAAKAKRAVENAKQLEAMMNESPMRRTMAPPIDVEISDESEPEDADYTKTTPLKRSHLGILEEDENEDMGKQSDAKHKGSNSHASATVEPLQDLEIPLNDESDIPTATFQVPPVSQSTPDAMTPSQKQTPYHTGDDKVTETALNSYPTPVSLVSAGGVLGSADERQKRIFSPLSTLPSPSFPIQPTKLSSGHSQVNDVGQSDELHLTPASEWSVDQVALWLKTKGFDKDICDKFIEQEITGDVLLELDANVLKSEIGIMAYGKRVRIANAIAELQPPPAFEFPVQHSKSNLPSPVLSQFHSPLSDSGVPVIHTRMKSQSQQSHHSFPGSGKSILTKHKYSQSMQSSVGGASGLVPHPQQEGEAVTTPVQDLLELGRQGEVSETTSPVGLGINLTSNDRPSSPSLSYVVLGGSPATTVPVPSVNDDRGHMSEGETVSTKSKRRRIFGRSQDSATSAVKYMGSKDSPTPSVTAREVDKDSGQSKEKSSPRNSGSLGTRRGKRGSDGKQADRLSIFGGSFVGPLSKHRKPPPKDDDSTERPSKFTLPKLHSRKSSASRSFTPLGSPYEKASITPSGSPLNEKHPNNNDFNPPDSTLRRRTFSTPHPISGAPSSQATGKVQQGQSILQQIGQADHAGWMRKRGDRYHRWKARYFVLQGPHLYILRSDSNAEKRLKGYINVRGYRVTVDEGIDPGRYGFRIDHDHDKTHYFSSEERVDIREWMKAVMKATIARDYTKPVISSCNIPTIPLVVAQTMNPAPRPPSPAARAATQRALLRENTSQLSSRDARVLMGLPADMKEDRPRADAYFSGGGPETFTSLNAVEPPRPSREKRRSNSISNSRNGVTDDTIIDWANSHLLEQHQIKNIHGPLHSGVALLRLAESIKGQPASPPVPDSAFPQGVNDENLDGFVRLFDFLLDNDVKIGSLTIGDIRFGKRDKVLQLLKGLKSWEEKRTMLSTGVIRSPQSPSYRIPVGL